MIRKTFISALALCALFLTALAPSASAQDSTDLTQAECDLLYSACVAYPAGGFGNANLSTTPEATSTPSPFPTATPVVEDVTATAGGAGEATIAFTGSESRVLGYVGAGLIGFGAVALATARRKNGSELN